MRQQHGAPRWGDRGYTLPSAGSEIAHSLGWRGECWGPCLRRLSGRLAPLQGVERTTHRRTSGRCCPAVERVSPVPRLHSLWVMRGTSACLWQDGGPPPLVPRSSWGQGGATGGEEQRRWSGAPAVFDRTRPDMENEALATARHGSVPCTHTVLSETSERAGSRASSRRNGAPTRRGWTPKEVKLFSRRSDSMSPTWSRWRGPLDVSRAHSAT